MKRVSKQFLVTFILLCGSLLALSGQISNAAMAGSKSTGESSLSVIIKQGIYRGLEECRNQFRNDSWNCSLDISQLSKGLPNFFKTNIPVATREAAFLHAIISAAITHEITLQCMKNRIPRCSCTNLKKRSRQGISNSQWSWGNCSDDLDFGENKTKQYIDNLEKGHDARTAFNLHNSDVGRKVVRTNIKRVCRLGFCYKKLAPFGFVGTELKRKYFLAIKASFEEKTHQGRFNNSYRQALVYFEESPNQCIQLGMLGRKCDGKEMPIDHCVDLCNSCKMQLKTLNYVKEYNCNCMFVWCCQVKCDTCFRNTSIPTCTKLETAARR